MTIEIHPAAEDERDEAALWYEAQRAGLGRDFAETVYLAMKAIEREPLSFPTYPADARVRRAFTGRFPYVVLYVVTAAGHPRVVAVAHGHRQPGYWADRMR